jgi:Fic family protein
MTDDAPSPDLKARVADRKRALDALRPLGQAALAQLQTHYDVELTFTSNAIEGNTLTYRETAEVIEHGLTVGGKPLRDHLEAVDHYAAVQWMREIAAEATPLGETTVTELHRRIVARSQPEIASFYSPYPRRVAGSAVVFPNPAKTPALMEAFGDWLRDAPATAETAFDAHFRLTAIHPFSDGNGRTARLLMNLILIRGGYPPVAVRPEDRKAYLDALEQASLSGDLAGFQNLMHQRLLDTLDAYVRTLEEAPAPPTGSN